MTDKPVEHPEIDFEKYIDVAINTDISLDVEVLFYKDFEANFELTSYVCVEGNLTNVSVDAQAYGWDTVVEIDAFVLTTDNSSNAYLSVISAVG